jgi:hypothetical protein
MHVNPSMKIYFQMAGALGFLLMAVDIWLAFHFGVSIDVITGFIYAMIAFGSGILLVIAAYYWITNVKPLAILMAVVWLPVFGFNVWSQIGTHTAGRMGDVQQASVQKAVHGEAEKSKTDLEAKQAFFIKRRETLGQNMVDLTQVKVGDWSVKTAPAAASDLDGLIAAKQLEVDNESKKVKCGPRCELRTNELAHLKRLKSLAKEIEDNEAQLKATETGLSNARTALAGTNAGNSLATNQSDLYARVMNMSLTKKAGKDQVMIANELTGIWSAFLLCIMSAALVFAEAWPRLMTVYREQNEASQYPTQAPKPYAPATAIRTRQASQGRDVVIVQPPVDNRDHDARAALENLRRTLGVAFNPTATR